MEESTPAYQPFLIEVEALPDPSVPFALPTGTVTFLLTDVAGSTLAWQASPTAMQAVIARHYELLHEIIGRRGGVRPVEQGEGDSVVGAFSRASDALAAALDAQLAFGAEPWPDGISLKVRMGVHTGEALQRDEGNYVGTTIIRTARIRNAGHGGQVLVSEAAAAIAADQLPAGSSLLDLGAHRLKDLARPERIWELVHPDLPRTTEPLRSLEAYRHNLPAQSTPLIGRRGELRSVVEELSRERLVTLSGAGGVGKTRLAAHTGAELLDRFAGGVWWIELAPLSDASAIAPAVLAAMGASEDGMRPALAVATDRLGGSGPALVIFDNCEHLIDGVAELIEHLRANCPEVVVLATSREPLGLPGEVVWRVPSLGTPPPDVSVTVESLRQYDAVTLFLDRARRARPQAVLTDSHAAAIADICVRLDGIPLAIELAAARCRQLSPERIAAELADRFKLLTGGARTLLPRQQTLLASVEWSHDLLDSDERHVLRRLAVFAGSFRWDAAEAVTSSPGDLDRWAVLDLLGRLVDKSLVLLEGERYRLLETVRQFALGKARESGELAALRDAHADWWIDHLESIDARQPSAESIQRCEDHIADLCNALEWIDGDLARRYRLLALVGLNWDYGGHSDVLLGYAERWVAPGPPNDEHLTAWALAYPAAANVFYRSLRFEILEHASIALDAIHAARDGRAALSSPFPYALLPGAERGAKVERSLELGQECVRLLATNSEFALPADVDASAVERWGPVFSAARGQHPDRRFRWPGANTTTDPAGPLCRFFALDMPPPSPGDERFLTDRLMTWAFAGLSGFLTGDRGLLDRALAALAPYTAVPIGRVWHAGTEGLLAVLDGGVVAVDHYQSIGRYTLHGPTNSRYVPARVLLAARANTEVAGLLATFTSPGAATVARPILDAVQALHADSVLEAADAVVGAAEAEVAYPWHELRPDIIELAAAVAHRLGDESRASALVAAALGCREEVNLRYRYVDQEAWITDIAPSDRVMSTNEAMALVRRGHSDRKRPSAGWDSLTPTERQVVELVADGLTNPQVAERLIMGRETVKTHLGHALGKLGMSNRTELAAAVAGRRAASM